MITQVTSKNANLYNALFDKIASTLTAFIPYKDGTKVIPDSGIVLLINSKSIFFSKDEADKWIGIFSAIEESEAEEVYYEYAEDPETGKFTEEILKVKIESLEAYYGILQQLVAIKAEYGVLPLDEPCFEIKANSRSIIIPPDFSVQVEGDEAAETIFFRINRYFDMTDLRQQQIAIQWENANGDKGYSDPWITFIDEAADDDYLVFGWAITSIIGEKKGIASKAGNVSFSVKFYRKENDKIIYSLNTLPAQLTIRRGMAFSLTDDKVIEETGMESVMLQRFQNGLVKGVNPPPPPIVVETNIEENKLYFIEDEEEEYELYAIANSPSAGNLSYGWYKLNNSDQGILCNSANFGRKVKTKTIKLGAPENEEFFAKYIVYADQSLINQITKEEDITDFDADGNGLVYLDVSYLMVKEPGKYYCSVLNHKGLQSASKATDKAIFPEPLVPTVAADMNEGFVSGVTLTPTITISDNTYPQAYNYTWFYKPNLEATSFTPLSGAGNSLTLVTNTTEGDTVSPQGYYYCQVQHYINNTKTPQEKAPKQCWHVYTAPTIGIVSNRDLVINGTDTVYSKNSPLQNGTTYRINGVTSDSELQLTIPNFAQYNQVYYTIQTNSSTVIVPEGTILGQDTIKISLVIGSEYVIKCYGKVGTNYISTSPIFETKIFAMS